MAERRVSEYTACRVPLVRVAFGDAFVVVHEGAEASVKRIEARWKAKGGNTAYRIRKADTGAYNCRKTTSGASWSKHSWGCAVDVNWQTNPYGRRLVTDMPKWFVQLWIDEGWGWGGNWSGVKDAMHFSKFPNEGGDGRLYVGEAPDEEDWLMALTDAEQKELLAKTRRNNELLEVIFVKGDEAHVKEITKRKGSLYDAVIEARNAATKAAEQTAPALTPDE